MEISLHLLIPEKIVYFESGSFIRDYLVCIEKNLLKHKEEKQYISTCIVYYKVIVQTSFLFVCERCC